MSDFVEVIQASKPNLKPITLKGYVSAFKNIAKIKGDVYKPNELFKLLNGTKKSELSKKTIYNTALIYLQGKKADEDIIKIYSDEIWRIQEAYVAKNESGVISENQAPNFITIEELHDLIKLIKESMIEEPGNKDFTAYTLYVLLTERPIRNDLAGMILITQSAFNKLKGEIKDNGVYLIKNKKMRTLYVGQYITTKTRPKEVVELTDVAIEAINNYIQVNKIKSGDEIFQFSKNYLSQLLIHTSKKYINKNISTLMIRKIITTDKFLDSSLEQKKHAEEIGHSVAIENLVYIKQPE
tara:strand:+ start:449 stop:1339 length:891 start_codon:yes stop_codon:yes gene_type:complete